MSSPFEFDDSQCVERIDNLTDAQKEMLPAIRDQWIKFGLSTEPANREHAEVALVEAYKAADVAPPPKIYWVQSPYEGHKLHCKLRNANDWVTPFYGQHDAFWLGFYDAFVKFGLRAVQKMRGLIELGKSAGWVWMFDECAIITERPVYVEQDQRNRLHSLTRKAIEYPDGWGLYMIHGIQVDERVVLHPETLTVADVDNERNAEVRRVLLGRFGEARYIEESGTECVATDDFGSLYRRELDQDEALCMVRVLNSTPEPDGTRKTYWLRVPPETRTPKEGVAWTFGLPAEQYNPVVET